MLSNKARLALYAIRENGELALDFVAGFSLQEFERDRRTFYAVTRTLEIISEAARRLPPELHARHPELPWRAIMGVGKSIATTTTTSPSGEFGGLCAKAFPHCLRRSRKKLAV